PPTEDLAGHYSVYVGKASPGTIASRISFHVANREGWDRALLVARVSTGYNSTDVGWLEGRLHDVVSASGYAEVANKATPGDDTISSWDKGALERVVTLVTSVMKVLGFRTDSPDGEGAIDKIAAEGSVFDVEKLHRAIGLVKAGEWSTYGDVAEVVGSHPRGVGAHIRHCGEDVPEWRILNRRGESQPGFTWTTRNKKGSQLDVLIDEGVPLVDGNRADQEAMVDAIELQKRLEYAEGRN
ncbi:MAG: MGMT family protein, partial [Acidimicrobiia bacterium]